MTPQDLVREITLICQPLFACVLRHTSLDEGRFRLLMAMPIEGQSIPLLLLGNASRRIEDGGCLAVLNPSKELADELAAGCGYPPGALKSMANGQCDAMVEIWFELYQEQQANVITTYIAEHMGPARMPLR